MKWLAVGAASLVAACGARAGTGGSTPDAAAGTQAPLDGAQVMGISPGGTSITVRGSEAVLQLSAVSLAERTRLIIDGGHAELRNVFVMGGLDDSAEAGDASILVSGGGELMLTDSFVRGTGRIGDAVRVIQGSAHASGSTILGPRGARRSAEGCALGVEAGAVATLRESLLAGSAALCAKTGGMAAAESCAFLGAVQATGPSQVSVRRSAIARAVEAVAAEGVGASILLEDSAVVESDRTCVQATMGATVTLKGVLVANTRADSAGLNGIGLYLGVTGSATDGLGASATLSRSAFLQNRIAGVLATGGTKLTVSDSIVAGTRPIVASRTGGWGLYVTAGRAATSVQLDRVAIMGSREIGVLAIGMGVQLTMRDSLVSRQRPSALDGTSGRGVEAYDGANVVISDSTFLENQTAALLVGPLGGSLDVSGTSILSTHTESDGRFGYGVVVRPGGRLRLARSFIRDHTVGMVLSTVSTDIQVNSSIIASSGLGVAYQDSGGTSPNFLGTGTQLIANEACETGAALPVPSPTRDLDNSSPGGLSLLP